MVIRHVRPLSIAKVAATVYAVMGVVFGALFSLIAVAGSAFSRTSSGAHIGAFMGVGAIVFFPILYGAIGFVMTLCMAWLYNIVAGVVGGVEVDVQ